MRGGAVRFKVLPRDSGCRRKQCGAPGISRMSDVALSHVEINCKGYN